MSAYTPFDLLPGERRDVLGEGPWWSVAEQYLYWVDIKGKSIRGSNLDGSGQMSIATPSAPSAPRRWPRPWAPPPGGSASRPAPAGPRTCALERAASGSRPPRSRLSSTARPSTRAPPARSASQSRSTRPCSARPCAPSALTAPATPPQRRPRRPPDGPKASPRWGHDRLSGHKRSRRVHAFAQVSDPRRSLARLCLTIWTVSNPARGTVRTGAPSGIRNRPNGETESRERSPRVADLRKRVDPSGPLVTAQAVVSPSGTGFRAVRWPPGTALRGSGGSGERRGSARSRRARTRRPALAGAPRGRCPR